MRRRFKGFLQYSVENFIESRGLDIVSDLKMARKLEQWKGQKTDEKRVSTVLVLSWPRLLAFDLIASRGFTSRPKTVTYFRVFFLLSFWKTRQFTLKCLKYRDSSHSTEIKLETPFSLKSSASPLSSRHVFPLYVTAGAKRGKVCLSLVEEVARALLTNHKA